MVSGFVDALGTVSLLLLSGRVGVFAFSLSADLMFSWRVLISSSILPTKV